MLGVSLGGVGVPVVSLFHRVTPFWSIKNIVLRTSSVWGKICFLVSYDFAHFRGRVKSPLTNSFIAPCLGVPVEILLSVCRLSPVNKKILIRTDYSLEEN